MLIFPFLSVGQQMGGQENVYKLHFIYLLDLQCSSLTFENNKKGRKKI